MAKENKSRTTKPQKCHTIIWEPWSNEGTMRKPRLPPARSLEITECKPHRQHSHRYMDTIQKPAMKLSCGMWKVEIETSETWCENGYRHKLSSIHPSCWSQTSLLHSSRTSPIVSGYTPSIDQLSRPPFPCTTPLMPLKVSTLVPRQFPHPQHEPSKSTTLLVLRQFPCPQCEPRPPSPPSVPISVVSPPCHTSLLQTCPVLSFFPQITSKWRVHSLELHTLASTVLRYHSRAFNQTLHASSLFVDNTKKLYHWCGFAELISCLTHTPWEWNRQRKLDFSTRGASSFSGRMANARFSHASLPVFTGLARNARDAVCDGTLLILETDLILSFLVSVWFLICREIVEPRCFIMVVICLPAEKL